MTEDDLDLLHRTVELATQALKQGNSPYGSLLVDPFGAVVFEDHNRDADGDLTKHPEFAIAKYAIENYSASERAACTVYTFNGTLRDVCGCPCVGWSGENLLRYHWRTNSRLVREVGCRIWTFKPDFSGQN